MFQSYNGCIFNYNLILIIHYKINGFKSYIKRFIFLNIDFNQRELLKGRVQS